MENFTLSDIKPKLENMIDVRYREIKFGKELVTLVFIDSLCDVKLISENIIAPLIQYDEKPIKDINTVKQEVLLTCPANEVDNMDKALNQVFSGDILIFFHGLDKVLSSDVKGYPKRAIDIPITETVVKGPREGINENLKDNVSAIRRRFKTADLKIEEFKLGVRSQTAVNMIYLDGVAPKKLINYVRDKINIINTSDYIAYANDLEEAMKAKGTPFDTITYSEKPDILSQKISEGRVIVLFDGDGFGVIAPHFFIENFQTTDDYTMNKFMSNTARILRWLSFLIATLVPGLYLALVTHHFRLIPSVLLFKMTVFRAGVPMPTVVELLIMILFFQIIREAGVRLPQPIGPTLSIVGALILGDAAVNSGLSSQVTVVIVGLTSICSYLSPKLYVAIFFWNTTMVVFAALLGLPGYYMGFILLVSHVSNLTSCDYPYFYPLGTVNTFKYKDIVTRGNLSDISEDIFVKDDEQ
ncbi:spore germination protein [Alkalibaculum sporogenes]|nr:spore germination protein [Alkalibaculum sporogenes]